MGGKIKEISGDDKIMRRKKKLRSRCFRTRRKFRSSALITTLLPLALYSCGHHSSYKFEQYRSLQFFLCATALQATEIPESELPRPINYYELLDLESPDIHRRPRTHALHNRKKRSTYRARITNDQIKKAYRKQAQLYHPDKLAARKLKEEKRNTTNITVDVGNDPLTNMTIEEATSLFARIAEAYQVLSDPGQRHEYDWDLLEMEDEYEDERLRLIQQRGLRDGENAYAGHNSFSLYETMRNGASNFNAWKDDLNLDPWSVFEDFFFQESSSEEEPQTSEEFYTSDRHYGYQKHHQPESIQRRPPRVSEQTIYRGFDPGYGAKMYTVLRREDYILDERHNDGQYFYQILGQDFVEGTQFDPYTGYTIREYYSAVTEPYLVEKGYSDKDDTYYDIRDDGYQKRKSSFQHRECIHKLEQGESITPNRSQTANHWISPNGMYEVVISPTCELQILRHDQSDQDPRFTVVWTTETYIPNSRAHGCHLMLDDLGRLVLSVDYGSGIGSATISNTILWSSPTPQVVPHLFEHNEQDSVTFQYYSSIDNDGTISIYRIPTNASESQKASERYAKSNRGFNRNKEPTSNGKDVRPHLFPERQLPVMIERLSVMYHRLSKASIEQKKTKAALAWDSLRYNIAKILKTQPRLAAAHNDIDLPLNDFLQQNHDNNNQNKPNFRVECVYSTSPVGCFTPGRNAIYLSKSFGKLIKKSVKSIDTKFEEFLSHITEPVADNDYPSFIYDDDDDDDDDDILDTLIRVTGAAGTKGIQLGKAGVRVAGKVVGKMKERVGKQSIKWGERMTENEDVDSFFG